MHLEVLLLVADPSDQDSQQRSGQDIRWVVPVVGHARARDEERDRRVARRRVRLAEGGQVGHQGEREVQGDRDEVARVRPARP